MDKILERSKAIEEKLLQMRRKLHTIPEIGSTLPETKDFVCKRLEELRIPYRTIQRDDSVIAEIKGGKAGKTVAFRADMDALNVEEKTDVPFKSQKEGRMHGCGHDAHTS